MASEPLSREHSEVPKMKPWEIGAYRNSFQFEAEKGWAVTEGVAVTFQERWFVDKGKSEVKSREQKASKDIKIRFLEKQ